MKRFNPEPGWLQKEIEFTKQEVSKWPNSFGYLVGKSIMSDFRARLMTERTELMQKVSKLETFLTSENSAKLEDVDRKDLLEQLSHMRSYLDVLDRRVSRLCNNV